MSCICAVASIGGSQPLDAVFVIFIVVLTLIGSHCCIELSFPTPTLASINRDLTQNDHGAAPALQLFQVTSKCLSKMFESSLGKATSCMACLRRLSKLQESAKTFIDTHFHDMNAILELAEVLGTQSLS